MKPLVLYHAGCADGFCTAWIAHQKFGDGAEYIPVNYGQEPPDVMGREVYILDFSYKRPVMEKLRKKAAMLVVLDHHKTAEAELAGFGATADPNAETNVVLRFDMHKSGGRLAWEYFNLGMPSPWIVDYTEDRDLWRWKLPQSKSINTGLRSYPMTFERWDDWYEMTKEDRLPLLTRLGDEGDVILRFQQQLIDQAVSVATEVDMDGHKVLSVNTTCMVSEIGERLAEGRPFAATFFIRSDGKKVWSLRSREGGIDVSEIARRHGGGGHKQAAGFTE